METREQMEENEDYKEKIKTSMFFGIDDFLSVFFLIIVKVVGIIFELCVNNKSKEKRQNYIENVIDENPELFNSISAETMQKKFDLLLKEFIDIENNRIYNYDIDDNRGTVDDSDLQEFLDGENNLMLCHDIETGNIGNNRNPAYGGNSNTHQLPTPESIEISLLAKLVTIIMSKPNLQINTKGNAISESCIVFRSLHHIMNLSTYGMNL